MIVVVSCSCIAAKWHLQFTAKVKLASCFICRVCINIALFFLLVTVLFICQFLIMPVASENGSAGDEMIIIVDLWTLLLLKVHEYN